MKKQAKKLLAVVIALVMILTMAITAQATIKPTQIVNDGDAIASLAALSYYCGNGKAPDFSKSNWSIQLKANQDAGSEWFDAEQIYLPNVKTGDTTHGGNDIWLMTNDWLLAFRMGDSDSGRSIPAFLINHYSGNTEPMGSYVYTVPESGVYKLYGNPKLPKIQIPLDGELNNALSMVFWIEKNGEKIEGTTVTLNNASRVADFPECEVAASKGDEFRFVAQANGWVGGQQVISFAPMCSLVARTSLAADGDFVRWTSYLDKTDTLAAQPDGAWKVEYISDLANPVWEEYQIKKLNWGYNYDNYEGSTDIVFEQEGVSTNFYRLYAKDSDNGRVPYAEFQVADTDGKGRKGTISYTASKAGKYVLGGHPLSNDILTNAEVMADRANDSSYKLDFYIMVNGVEVSGSRRQLGFNGITAVEMPTVIVDLEEGDKVNFMFEPPVWYSWHCWLSFVPAVYDVTPIKNISYAGEDLLKAVKDYLPENAGELIDPDNGVNYITRGDHDNGLTYGATDWSFRVSYNGDGAAWDTLNDHGFEAGYAYWADVNTGSGTIIRRRGDLIAMTVQHCSEAGKVIPSIEVCASKGGASNHVGAITYTAPVKGKYLLKGDDAFPYIQLFGTETESVNFWIQVNGVKVIDTITVTPDNIKALIPRIVVDLNKGDKVDFCVNSDNESSWKCVWINPCAVICSGADVSGVDSDADVAEIRSYLLSKTNDVKAAIADVNGDGKLNVMDIVAAKAALAK